MKLQPKHLIIAFVLMVLASIVSGIMRGNY